MQEAPVTGGLLDGVADGVAEIQQRAQAEPLELVRRDDVGLDFQVAPDDPRKASGVRRRWNAASRSQKVARPG